MNNKKLNKLRKAKLGIHAIDRAIKKNNFILLRSDHITEIDDVKWFWPEIDNFAGWLRSKRS